MLSRRNTLRLGLGAAALAAASAAGWGMLQSRRLSAAAELAARPVPAPTGGLSVFHLGHSLVGRDMPAMLAQIAPEGHDFASQLGWGTSLREHWYPDVPVNGFETENDHPKFLPARQAIDSGAFDAIVLTEMVELRDAIAYHDSPEYLAEWAAAARAARPDARLYLYETWHHTDDPDGWLARIDTDFDALWLRKLALPAVAQAQAPIHLIPAGQVLAAFVRAVEDAGGVGTIADRNALLARTPEGAVDTIHLSDLGAYLVALVHYSVLYQRAPMGLPYQLLRADGSPADAPDAAAAALMQQTVWDVVRQTPYTGLST